MLATLTALETSNDEFTRRSGQNFVRTQLDTITGWSRGEGCFVTRRDSP
jgi:hypothetical protein